MTRTIAIIQARMASSRLPDKVLLDIGGRPMLDWVIERTQRANLVDKVIVATTTDPSDDPVAAFCSEHGYTFTRGSEPDVLDRYYQTAKPYAPENIVRITADCPLLDPELVNETVQYLNQSNSPTASQPSFKYDFVTNRLPQPWGRTYPIGLDVEAFTWHALQQVWHDADQKHHREHVTPYFYEDIPVDDLHFKENQPSPARGYSRRGFQVALLHYAQDYGHLRWTVDTPEDLNFVRAVVARLDNTADFTWLNVLTLVQHEPELTQINAAIKHKTHLDVDRRN
ncbi:MAG: glycosyltransferase family protein [Chloroflexota bacterium]